MDQVHIWGFFFGLGLLLLGLGEMKSGFGSLAEHFDISMFSGHHPVVYLLAGAAFTAVIQSSSATMMILFSALNADIIDLFAAAALLIGADLGTTSTVLLDALKRQSTWQTSKTGSAGSRAENGVVLRHPKRV